MKDLSDVNAKFQKIKEFELQSITINAEEINNKNANANIQKKNSILTANAGFELALLIEEKNNLIIENKTLLRKIAYYENEMKYKFISKDDYEKKLQMMESERIIYSNKLKNLENLCGKLQKELNVAKAGKEDLRTELEKSQQKYLELLEKSSPNQVSNFYNGNIETPLNMILDDDLYPEHIKEINLVRKTITKYNQGDDYNFDIFDNPKQDEYTKSKKDTIITSKFNIEEDIQKTKKNESSEAHKTDFLQMTLIDNKSQKTNERIIGEIKETLNHSINENIFETKFTLNEILERTSKNEKKTSDIKSEMKSATVDQSRDNSIMKKPEIKNLDTNLANENINKSNNLKIFSSEKLNSNFKYISNKKITPSKPLRLNTSDYYKSFFMLTYQAIKMNQEEPDILENIDPEYIYKNCIERGIQYHKKEIKEYKSKRYSKQEYNKNKSKSVLNYLASKLY